MDILLFNIAEYNLAPTVVFRFNAFILRFLNNVLKFMIGFFEFAHSVFIKSIS